MWNVHSDLHVNSLSSVYTFRVPAAVIAAATLQLRTLRSKAPLKRNKTPKPFHPPPLCPPNSLPQANAKLSSLPLVIHFTFNFYFLLYRQLHANTPQENKQQTR